MIIKKYFQDIQIGTFFLGLVCFFPLFPIHFNSYAIILFVFVCLLNSLSSKQNKEKVKRRFFRNYKILLTSTSIVYIFILTLLYTQNLSYGLRSLQHTLSLLIFPVIIFLFMEKLSAKEMNLLLTVFVSACVLQVIHIHYNFYVQGLYNRIKEVTFYNLPFRETVLNLKYESQHPTYLSLWYIFSIAILLNRIPKRPESYKSLGLIFFSLLLISLLISTIVMLSSRIGVLGLILVLGIYIFRLKSNSIKWGLFFILFFAVIFSFKNISFLSSRFISEFKATEIAPPVGKAHNSLNIRIGIYQCAMNIIVENPILGIGIGDVQDSLNNCYSYYDTDAYTITNYNSHNYYFNVLLASGILGLIVFLSMFYVYFKLATLNSNYLYICFLTTIFIAMFFENIFSRNHGVLFFSIFNTVFVQSFYYIKNANRIHSAL